MMGPVTNQTRVASAPTDASARALGPREFVLFMALVSSSGALAVDMVLPAFASMRPEFGLAEDSSRLSLTITLFFAGSGVGQLISGPVADAVGRKRLLTGSLILYGASALASALAPSLGLLLVARFVWGVAAAGPRILSQAIVRDLYEGDAMARIMTLVQTVFFIAPVAAPLIGTGLVQVGSWRWVMGFGVANALVVLAWSTRLQETLPPERRRPLKPAVIGAGFAAVMRNRVTLGYALSVSFAFATLYSFLGTSELIFDDVFDRSEWFVAFFSLLGLTLGTVTFGTNRLLQRQTGRYLAIRAGIAMICSSALLLALCVIGGGTPPIALWIPAMVVTIASGVAYFPTANALAMEPMGAQAGTAAAVLGFLAALIGSALAVIINEAYNGTVTPAAAGYFAFSVVAFGLQLWARGATPEPTADASPH
jgi:DHA1 family bicyclomycin/chloramphenicol resistance-like MFS transporter